MKKLLLTLALVATAGVAFGQGRITAENGNSLITFTTDSNHMSLADVGLTGMAVPNPGPLPSGITLEYGLYAGTASGSLSLVTTTIIDPVGGNGQPAGTILPFHVVLPFPGGAAGSAPGYFQVKIWDHAYASYEAQVAAVGAGDYSGLGAEFSMTPGTFAYPGIDTQAGSTYQNVPIVISETVPEPATFALVGLGAAAMLILRRRK